MKLDFQKNCSNDARLKDVEEIREVKGMNSVLRVNGTNLEQTNGDKWELEQWEDSSTSEGLMTEEQCGEVCSILCHIRRGSLNIANKDRDITSYHH